MNRYAQAIYDHYMSCAQDQPHPEYMAGLMAAREIAESVQPEVVHSQKCICPNCGTQMAWDLGIPSMNSER